MVRDYLKVFMKRFSVMNGVKQELKYSGNRE